MIRKNPARESNVEKLCGYDLLKGGIPVRKMRLTKCVEDKNGVEKGSCVCVSLAFFVEPASAAFFWLLSSVFVWFVGFGSSVFGVAWWVDGCFYEFSPSSYCWVWGYDLVWG